jgi:Tol biopolymer transport system component
MTLAPGIRLGPYEITGPIGAGGMGEVYKAKDTRLDRSVAIKVLPPEFCADPDRRARFEREAKTIGGLNPSHICTLYDVGEHDGSMFLVMEHLAGETLAARLGKGPMPLDQALTIGADIAEALATAHRQGVIHRDLKPGNVMLAKGGAKLLDFGLAKLKTPGALGMAGDSALTAQEPRTAAGTFLGTVPYTAPEQLEGKETDARSDIFSFGAVLYEMVTGRRAFPGESHASVISAIMSSQPPVPSSVRPVTPPALDRLVQRCLAKDPDARWQSATDVADELRWISAGSGSGAGVVAAAGQRATRRRTWPWFAAAGILLAVATGATWWRKAAADAVPGLPTEPRDTQVTFSGDVTAADLSPDGLTLAYMERDRGGQKRLLVRDVAGRDPLEIWRGGEGAHHAWTPDGTQILVAGFAREGREADTWLVPRFGGAPRRLFPPSGTICALSPDGLRLATTAMAAHAYAVLSLSSGERVARPLPESSLILGLSWNRSGDQLAVVGAAQDGTSAVWIVTPADGRVHRVLKSGGTMVTGACWSPVADALYLERQHPKVTEVVRVTFGTQEPAKEEHLLTGLPSSSPCRVSLDGQTLIQTRAFSSTNLWRLDLGVSGATTPLTTGTSTLVSPAFSSDGQWVLATLEDREPPELVRLPERGGPTSPFVADGRNGRWSPDGRQLAFVSSRTGRARVWVANANGDNARELQGSEVGNPFLYWWPDGRLAWQTPDIQNYRVRDLATGRDELLVTGRRVGFVFSPLVSPAGDQIAVYLNRKEPGVYLMSGPERRERLLARGFLDPIAWARDGASIYAYRRKTPEVVRIAVATGVVQVIGRFPVGVIDDSEMCSMARDGGAITCSVTDMKSDAWLVAHFDPHVPSAKR